MLIYSFNRLLKFEQAKQERDFMFLPKRFFQEVLQYVSEEGLEEIATKRGQAFANHFKLERKQSFAGQSIEDILPGLLSRFEKMDLNWFNSTKFFKTSQNHFNLQIIHNFQENGSKFFSFFLTRFVQEAFDIKCISESLTDETIDLEFL